MRHRKNLNNIFSGDFPNIAAEPFFSVFSEGIVCYVSPDFDGVLIDWSCNHVMVGKCVPAAVMKFK